MWQVDNRLGTFIASGNTAVPPPATVADLRTPLLLNDDDDGHASAVAAAAAAAAAAVAVPDAAGTGTSGGGGSGGHSRHGSDLVSNASESNLANSSADLGPRVAVTHEFTRVWWETGEAGAGRAASLWRPMAPPGHASLGDVLVTGVEPPPHGAPTVSVRGGAAVRPVAFDLVCSAGSGRGRGLRENKHSTLNRRKNDIGGPPSARARVTVNAPYDGRGVGMPP